MNGTAVTQPLEQRVCFHGSIGFAWPPLGERPTLAVVDGSETDELGLLDEAAALVRLERRPDSGQVALIADAIVAVPAERVIGIGSGAAIDAVKVAVRRVERDTGEPLELVFVPCGAEPYRAVAPFAVVDDGLGERPTVVDERFTRTRVHVVGELLERRAASDIAVHALDTAVHACESLLGALANPSSQALAASALENVAAAAASGLEGAATRTRLMIASFNATEAFVSTRLGIAHAIASPLGTECALTHDTINGIIGARLLEFWGPEAPGLETIARACGAADAQEATALLDALRVAAGLPATLAEFEIDWQKVEAILPRAARSSGIAVLPRPLAEGELEAFARIAWQGRKHEDGVCA